MGLFNKISRERRANERRAETLDRTILESRRHIRHAKRDETKSKEDIKNLNLALWRLVVERHEMHLDFPYVGEGEGSLRKYAQRVASYFKPGDVESLNFEGVGRKRDDSGPSNLERYREKRRLGR